MKQINSSSNKTEGLIAPVSFQSQMVAALSYFLVALVFSKILVVPHFFTNLIWPPAGIALVFILLNGPKISQGIFLGAFTYYLSVGITQFWDDGHTIILHLLLIAFIALGVTLQAIIGAVLIRKRIIMPNLLIDKRSIISFIMLGGFLSCLISTSITHIALFLTQHISANDILISSFIGFASNSLGVIIFAPCIYLYVLAKRNSESTNRAVWNISILSIVFAMLIISFYSIQTFESQKLKHQFHEETESVISRVESHIQRHLNAVLFLQTYFNNSKDITSKKYTKTIKYIKEHYIDIKGAGWLALIEGQNREAYENACQNYFGHEFSILEFDRKSNKFVRASEREFYAPIQIVDLVANQEKLIGVDILTLYDKSNEAIENALKHQSPVFSRPLSSIFKYPDNQDIIYTVAPTYGDTSECLPHSSLNQEIITGLVGFTLSVSDFFKPNNFDIEKENIEYTVYQNDTDGKKAIYSTRPDINNVASDNVYTRNHKFNLGYQQWQLQLEKTLPHFAFSSNPLLWITLVVAFIIVTLLSPLLLLITGNDIHLKNTLAERETQLSNIVNNIDDLIFRINKQGKFIYLNPACMEITGFSENLLLDMNFLDLVHPEYREHVQNKMIEHANNNSGNMDIDYLIVTKYGDEIWLSQHTQITFNENGDIEYLALARDVTKQIQYQQDLITAQEAKEASIQFHNDFLASISHELRTPMHAIIGTTNMLIETDLNENQNMMVSTLNTASRQLLVLVKDILDLTSLEKGKIELNTNIINSQQLLTDIEQYFGKRCQDKNLKIICTKDESIPDNFIGDRHRLQQILWNLINNSIKYTDTGSISIKMELESNDENKNKIKFIVQDTGIGIAESDKDAIFDRFFRANEVTKQARQGTGLGLAIVKELIKLMHGHISFNSTVGEGTTFTAIIPFDIHTKETNIIDDDDRHGTMETSTDIVNILLVDDNEMNIYVVSNQIKNIWPKASITTAEDGLAGIDSVKNNNYEIILMDLQMPKMSGYEAVKVIRSMDAPKNEIPVIALTAGIVKPEEIHNAGFNDFLLKPFRPRDLKEKITKCLLVNRFQRYLKS
jgi:PAS domain S-box-containing protein